MAEKFIDEQNVENGSKKGKAEKVKQEQTIKLKSGISQAATAPLSQCGMQCGTPI